MVPDSVCWLVVLLDWGHGAWCSCSPTNSIGCTWLQRGLLHGSTERRPCMRMARHLTGW